MIYFGIPIPSSQSMKYLGLALDQTLTWAQHVRKTKLYLNNRLRVLKNLNGKKATLIDIKLFLYKTLSKVSNCYK